MSAGKPTGFVLDCSITMAWCFSDEESNYTIAAQEKLLDVKAIVPSIWPYEVANVLYVAQRKKRITYAQAVRFKNLLKQAPIIIDDSLPEHILTETLDLACKQVLSVYDAAYLELAMREGLPLATLDNALREAAHKVGVSLLKG